MSLSDYMSIKDFNVNPLIIQPVRVQFHVPPYVWKGDPIGHVGGFDLFFWVLKGEIILFVDSQYYLVRAGQLAFLPRGKMRKYTQISKEFSMYEMRFIAEYEDKNLMESLGLTEQTLVVDIDDKEQMNKLFETSHHNELNRKITHNTLWCANILNIIDLFSKASNEQSYEGNTQFIPVIEYMQNNLNKIVSIDDLAALIHMQPTYFIRKFKKFYGVPPLVYFGNIRIHKAMELLLTTDKPIDVIAKDMGIDDTSYFTRWFKKSCNLTPSEYRKIFRKQ